MTKTLTALDVLVYVKLSETRHLKQCLALEMSYQTMSCIRNVI